MENFNTCQEKVTGISYFLGGRPPLISRLGGRVPPPSALMIGQLFATPRQTGTIHKLSCYTSARVSCHVLSCYMYVLSCYTPVDMSPVCITCNNTEWQTQYRWKHIEIPLTVRLFCRVSFNRSGAGHLIGCHRQHSTIGPCEERVIK